MFMTSGPFYPEHCLYWWPADAVFLYFPVRLPTHWRIPVPLHNILPRPVQLFRTQPNFCVRLSPASLPATADELRPSHALCNSSTHSRRYYDVYSTNLKTLYRDVAPTECVYWLSSVRTTNTDYFAKSLTTGPHSGDTSHYVRHKVERQYDWEVMSHLKV